MGIDAKETGAILWKILESSMNTSIKFMRTHPILSGVSMFLLMLYIFLPSLLFFLIYSSPVLACVVVYVREKLGLRFSGSHKPFSTSREKSCGEGEKSGGIKCHLRQQRSVRRNARMKVEEWDSKTSEEEKDKVILTSLYNDLLGRTPHFEESPKAETDVVEEDNEKILSVEDSKMFSCDFGNLTEKPTVYDCEINEEKYGDLEGKEETREKINNVNEYGISEIERNKRLESLIARRRARRLFKLALDQRNKLQAEETSSPKQSNNLQITVPKNMNNNNILGKNRNYPSNNAVTGLQMPGSAPSVLLQGRNPFDIPYDPQEERPNLTGDSFDEEFSLFNQKDMFFCRHESFCRFAFFSSEPTQCMNSPASTSDISTIRKHLDLDNEYMDHQIEKKLHCDGKEDTMEDEDKSVESVKNEEKEVEMNEETDSNKEEGDDDSSSSEDSESELNRLNKVELREAICHSMDNYPGFLVNQARNSIPSPIPKAGSVVAPRLDDNNMFYTRRCPNLHSRTFSVASDMQVEVSEIGSPPTTVDWLDEWSNGGESYTYDTDIDREIIRGEELQNRLSQQCESSSGKGENNGLETKPMAETNQKCVVDEHLKAVDDTPLLNKDRKTEEDVKQVVEEISDQRPCNLGDVFERSNSGKFDGLMFHTSVSLSSITEEPETVLDSICGILENMNSLTEEETEQRSSTPLDSLVDKEVVDEKKLDNDDLFGSHTSIGLDITKHQQWNNVQGEHGTQRNMKKYEKTKPEKYEAVQSSLDASFDISNIKTFEREMDEDKKEEEPNLGNFTEEKTKQRKNEALQSDFKSSPGQYLTELLESKITEENGLILVDNFDDKAEPLEKETTQIVLKGSPSNPHTHLVEDDENVLENVENLESVIAMQVQESNNSTLGNSMDQSIFEEAQKSRLMKDICATLTIECNNRTNVEEEPAVSTNIQNSQPLTQQCNIISSESISPRTLEITIQPNHEEDPNTVSQDISKEFAVVAGDTACGENNDEEDIKLGEAMEKKLELNLEPMHHSIDLVVKENDEGNLRT